MKIVHIVSSIKRINFGVWNAAIFGSNYLLSEHGVTSELWVCGNLATEQVVPDIQYHFFHKEDLSLWGYKHWLSQYDPKETIIVTHGAWLQPTRLGYRAKWHKYYWIYVPHGMHEQYELVKGRFKKWIYFNMLERPMARKADAIRAVSETEKNNLVRQFNRKIHVVYNGIVLNETDIIEKPSGKLNFLFMARLQRKKGLVFLVKAWSKIMHDITNAQLLIAGPDEGELEKIKPFLKQNIIYLGPQFGDKKLELLRDAHYYVLPSYSEGFPTSVVEAMGYGAIPIISRGCNFPQVFAEGLGYEVKPDETSIIPVLELLRNKPFDKDLSSRNIRYVYENLTDRKIGEDLYRLYCNLLMDHT